jgi:hypothetical protein
MSVKFLFKVCAVAALGGLLFAASCAHNSLTVDECVAQRLASYVPAQARQARACNKDVNCLVSVGLAAAIETANDINTCEASAAPAAPAPAQVDGGTGGQANAVLYFNGPAQEI